MIIINNYVTSTCEISNSQHAQAWEHELLRIGIDVPITNCASEKLLSIIVCIWWIK